MARLAMPDLPEGPLRTLMAELHLLHARAGWPSAREIARGLDVSHTTVHVLLTRTAGPPSSTLLLDVVERLTQLARRVDPDATLDLFDMLWHEAAGLPCNTIGPATPYLPRSSP